MDGIARRSFLRGALALTGGAVATGPLQTLLAAAAGADPPGALGPVPDLRDGVVRLHLPSGFAYRSFHDTESPVVLTDGTQLPGRHDGMAAFPAADGNVWLVRNHEINGAGPVLGPGTPYDSAASGGTTTVLVTPTGELIESFTSLNGTQMNCAGSATAWGTFLSCEETVNGPDVGPDFTGVPNTALEQRHGFVFEVPAGGQSDRTPLTMAGRFAHEDAVFERRTGFLYLTEDNFGFPSGLYRYKPPADPTDVGRILDGGHLQMLRVVGVPEANLAADQVAGATYAIDWVDIPDPAPTFPYTPGQPAPTSNDEAITYVGRQGRADGAAWFSRLEGATVVGSKVYFMSTQGGGVPEGSAGPVADGFGNGHGQVWRLDPVADTLTCVHQSAGPASLDFPDNITSRNGRGTLVLCEDGVADNYVRGLRRDGSLFDIALNRLRSASDADRSNDEFAGATFSPDGQTLFVNIQASRGITIAIWGPWGRLGV